MPTTPAPENDHTWMGAANVPLDTRTARRAEQRGSVRLDALDADTKIVVLEVYCGACRRPFDDVKGQPCAALINNEHLRGGPIGERKKRKVTSQDGDLFDPLAGLSDDDVPYYAQRRAVTGYAVR